MYQTKILLLLSVSFIQAFGFVVGPHLPLPHPRVGTIQAFEAASAGIQGTPSDDEARSDKSGKKIGDITFLISSHDASIKSKFGLSSPIGSPSIAEAVRHLANKAFWFADGKVETNIVLIPEVNDQGAFERICQADVLIAMGVETEDEMDYVKKVFETRRLSDGVARKKKCQFALDCRQSIPPVVGPYDEASPSLQAALIPWSEDATARRLCEQMTDAFGRWTSDDFCYAIMIFLNQFSGSKVDWVKHSIDATWEKGVVRNVRELYGMVSKCSDCIGNCLADETCRECIGKLTEIDSRDQVTSYRTIVSYESDLLRDFSQCILTKNNVFECDAVIPSIPEVNPISRWRGKELTEEDGRAILVGHLDDPAAPEGGSKSNVSWMVACGANVAYDQFPSQHQLFYPASRGKLMWYDPCFRTETLDGRHVWCTRHYRVRPGGPKPGTFRFSVLDNGVTSDEYWNIVGAADDLSWVVFHYAGAAASVGQQYIGGLLCTADGSMPDESKLPRVWECLLSAGLQPWELYVVDNSKTSPGAIAAGPPPLDTYRADVLRKRVANT